MNSLSDLNMAPSSAAASGNVPQPTTMQQETEERIAYVNPIARVLLAGSLLASNSASPLQELCKGMEVLELIYNKVRSAWREEILLGPPRCFETETVVNAFNDEPNPPPPQSVQLLDEHWHPVRNEQEVRGDDVERVQETLSVMRVGQVTFPAPTGTNINMMPFVLGVPRSLPPYLQRWVPLINACTETLFGEHWRNSTAHLTIYEHRADERAPAHTGRIQTEFFFEDMMTSMWYPAGLFFGHWGGVFTASSVSHSSRIWNAQLQGEGSAIMRTGCGSNVARCVLNEMAECVEPEAGELYWMTDKTPHELLPVPSGAYRQHFMLVIGDISRWKEQNVKIDENELLRSGTNL